jgi:hypothetical protein
LPAGRKTRAGGVAACGLALALCLLAPVAAQGDPDFGLEFEFRGRETTPKTVAERTFNDYAKVLEPVVRALGGDPSAIKRVDFTKTLASGEKRPLMRAEWTDVRGRMWKVEPEWVTGGGRQQVDFELVTPRLNDPAELRRVIGAVRDAKVVREGLQSSVHIHVDAKGLVAPGGDATALVNLIQLHEGMEPLLRRLFAPSRGAGIFNPKSPTTGPEGAWVNRFNRPIYLDHPQLLEALAQLKAGDRTVDKIEGLFRARAAEEAKVHGEADLSTKGWKYRSLNLANLLDLNPNLPRTKHTVEFRMNDLNLSDPSAHTLQVELYRALVQRAKALASQGKVVAAPKRTSLPKGQDPARFYTSDDPLKARAELRNMIKELGLDPKRYEGLLARNVRGPPALDPEAFRTRLRGLKLPPGVLSSAGDRTTTGDGSLHQALAALRSVSGARPDLILRLPTDANSMSAALASARALAKRANAALYVRGVGHAGVERGILQPATVRVEAGANEVVLRLAPGNLPFAQLEALAQLLARGTHKNTLLRGTSSGLPGRPPGGLVGAAVAYADAAEGRKLTTRTQRALQAIQGKAGAQVFLPLLAWEGQEYLSQATQRDLRYRAERYLSQLIEIAEAMPAARHRTLEPAARQARTLARDWARQTGVGELLYRSLLPNRVSAPTIRERLERYRRADGTLDWKRLTRERALREAGGVAHFALALFLKEVAVVASTGDRARIEEFFEGLLTTDFYKHYGLFVAGARLGEVAYAKYLQRYIRPRFVSGLLKTNLVLAAGMALPMIVEGRFEGRTFAISVASLGLSSTAVRAGVSSIKWVLQLKKARKVGVLARLGVGSRLARAGGWFYTVAELAVVLYVADHIDKSVTEWLDGRAARAKLSEAGVAFLEAINDPRVTPASVRAASDAYHNAWIDYRDFLYGPLHADELTLAARLEKVARQARILATRREGTLARLDRVPSIKANVISRFGSLEAYSSHLLRKDEEELQAKVKTYLQSYEATRSDHLREVYEDNRRSGDLLAGIQQPEWALRGSRTNSPRDPWGSRGDLFARWGRTNSTKGVAAALGNVSSNRLQAYEDEAALLERLAAMAKADGRAGVSDELTLALERVKRLHRADAALVKDKGVVDTQTRAGLSQKIQPQR